MIVLSPGRLFRSGLRAALPGFASALLFLAPGNAEGEQPLRVVATGGRIAYTFYSPPAGLTAFHQRTPHQLGGPVAEIRVGLMDWMYTDKTEVANSQNDVVIDHAWLERAATGEVAPLVFSGARQLVLPMNSSAPYWLSDPIPSTVWSRGPPQRDELFWLHLRGRIPEGGKLPVGTPAGYPGAGFLAHPPTENAGPVDTAGLLPPIANATRRTDALPVIVLGRYAEPGHLSVIGIGDSILHGSGDSTRPEAHIAGYGFFNRAAVDRDGRHTIALFNLTRHGQTAAAWVNPARQNRQRPFLRFANVVVEEYGTNDLSARGSGDPDTILARLESIWSAARQSGVQRIVRTLLLPRTASDDGWSTSQGQTPNPGWEAGGKRDEINEGLRTALAEGLIDALVDTLAAVADPADQSRWLSTGKPRFATPDGTHVSPAGNILLAAPLRDALLALRVDEPSSP